MLSIIKKRLRHKVLAMLAGTTFLLALLVAAPARADIAYNTQFTPSFDFFGSGFVDSGWYWVVPSNATITEIQTEFNSNATFNFANNTGNAMDRNVTLEILTAPGGTVLGSETFNSSIAGFTLAGAPLNTPVTVNSGQVLFIGLLNVEGLGINVACFDNDANDPGCPTDATAFGPPSLGGAFLDGGNGLFDSGPFSTPGSCASVDCPIFNFVTEDTTIGGGGNPPAATPEPGTLTLMGTGLLGVAGVLRRRFRMA